MQLLHHYITFQITMKGARKQTILGVNLDNDKKDGTDVYKNKHGLPIDIRKEILPIYHALTKPELLKKCLHGKTQNANESFNGMIWNRIPKATHVGINNLSLGVYDAIAHFNYGMKATLDVFKMLNIEPGIYTMQICDNLNKERKCNSLYKISDKYKKRQKY